MLGLLNPCYIREGELEIAPGTTYTAKQHLFSTSNRNRFKKKSPRFVFSPHHRGFNNTSNFILSLKSHLVVFHTKWKCKTAPKQSPAWSFVGEIKDHHFLMLCFLCYYFYKCMNSADDTTAPGGFKTPPKKTSPKKSHTERATVWRVVCSGCNPKCRYLFLEQQSHPFKELVAIDGGEGDVEEEAEEHRLWDPLQGEGQQQQGKPHQEICHQARQPGLLHAHNPASRKRWVRRWGGSPKSIIYPSGCSVGEQDTCLRERETHPHHTEISTADTEEAEPGWSQARHLIHSSNRAAGKVPNSPSAKLYRSYPELNCPQNWFCLALCRKKTNKKNKPGKNPLSGQ